MSKEEETIRQRLREAFAAKIAAVQIPEIPRIRGADVERLAARLEEYVFKNKKPHEYLQIARSSALQEKMAEQIIKLHIDGARQQRKPNVNNINNNFNLLQQQYAAFQNTIPQANGGQNNLNVGNLSGQNLRTNSAAADQQKNLNNMNMIKLMMAHQIPLERINGMLPDHEQQAAVKLLQQHLNGGNLNRSISANSGTVRATKDSISLNQRGGNRKVNSPSQSNSQSSEEKRTNSTQLLQQQQERLMILKHVSKCNLNRDGTCPQGIPSCPEYKPLWNHIALDQCTDPHCKFTHCISSRYVLKHFYSCYDNNCPVCKPVKEGNLPISRPQSGRSVSQPQMSRQISDKSSGNSKVKNSAGGGKGNLSPHDFVNYLKMVENQRKIGAHSQQQVALNGQMGGQVPFSQVNPTPMQEPSAVNFALLANSNPEFLQFLQTYQQNAQAPLSQPSQRVPNTPNLAALNRLINNSDANPNPLEVLRPPTNEEPSKSTGRKKKNETKEEAKKKNPKKRPSKASNNLSQTRGDSIKPTVPLTSPPPFPNYVNNFPPMKQPILVPPVPSKRKQNVPVKEQIETLRTEILQCREYIKEMNQNGASQEQIDKIEEKLQTSAKVKKLAKLIKTVISDEEQKVVRQCAAERNKSLICVYEILADYVLSQQGPIIELLSRQISLFGGGDAQKAQKSSSEPQESTSFIDSLADCHIESHLQALKPSASLTASTIKGKCNLIIDDLKNNFDQHFRYFEKPVSEYKEFNLPDYYDIIRNPMDFGTIKQKLKDGKYEDIENFRKDGNLVFDNCITYNSRDPNFIKLAQKMRQYFNKEFDKMKKQMMKEQEQAGSNSDTCAICYKTDLFFEPPIFYCNGMACNGTRIRRNAFFYTDRLNRYHYCTKCFDSDFKSGEVQVGSTVLRKLDFNKKKNEDVAHEDWVECTKCKRWLHWICTLFNSRTNSDDGKLLCPNCVLGARKKSGKQVSKDAAERKCEQIKHTEFTEFCEKRVWQKIEEYMNNGEPLRPKIPPPEKKGYHKIVKPDVKCENIEESNEGSNLLSVDKNTNVPNSESKMELKSMEGGSSQIILEKNNLEKTGNFHQSQTTLSTESLKKETEISLPQNDEEKAVVTVEVALNQVKSELDLSDTMKVEDMQKSKIQSMLDPIENKFQVEVEISSDSKEAKTNADMILESNSNSLSGLNSATNTSIFLDQREKQKLKDKEKDKNKGNKKEKENKKVQPQIHPMLLLSPEERELRKKEIEGMRRENPFFIRQVSCLDKGFPTRDCMLQRYSGKYKPYPKENLPQGWSLKKKENDPERSIKLESEVSIKQEGNASSEYEEWTKCSTSALDNKYPSTFDVRSKCIVVFQNIDGIDVILFVLYVYEYGHSSPNPNQRRVYISYLDSVHFFKPRYLRTLIYQEILVAYIAYIKARGFHTVHIWACPPVKGDNYILFCHPVDQRVPTGPRLINWYQTMLDNCVQEGSVLSLTNLYDDYFLNPLNDATCLPYLEGDWWIGEAEVCIKEMEEEEGKEDDKSDVNGEMGTKKRKGMKKNSRKGKDKGKKDEEEAYRDPLMVRIGKPLKDMKDSFLVAKLHPQSFIDECAERQRQEIIAEENKDEEFEPAFDETQDPDDVHESEIFDTRQEFLEFCKGNHYQYDELRRAKHSSMMALYHFINPGAPKFLPICNNCGKEITHIYKYVCPKCEDDYTLCQKCYEDNNSKTKDARHPHPLVQKSIRQPKQVNSQAEGRRELIERHLVLLIHSLSCTDDNCRPNCLKMKELVGHHNECLDHSQCLKCTRLIGLVKEHAKTCKKSGCLVPRCKILREKWRLKLLETYQMEDRRRAAQNQLIGYRPELNNDDDEDENTSSINVQKKK